MSQPTQGLLTKNQPITVGMENVTVDTNNDKNEERLQRLADWLNKILPGLTTAEERLQFILNHLVAPSRKNAALTTSFGIQSALMLHLVKKATMQSPHSNVTSVPVVWIDTGYLFEETYHFAERLRVRFDLDLKAYQGSMSPARMEAMLGKLWEDPSSDAHEVYNYLRKVEPMNRALEDLNVSIVLSGVRSSQSSHRKKMDMVHVHDGRLKICPILDWSDDQVAFYFEKHGLPYHPLSAKGYRTVGDWHSSQPYDPSVHSSERQTRFHGRSQECGLHLDSSQRDLRSSFRSLIRSFAPLILENEGFVLYTKPSCRYCKGAKALIGYLRDALEKQEQEGKDSVGYDFDSNSTDSTTSSSVSSSSAFLPVQEFEVGTAINRAELEISLGRTIKTVPQILWKDEYIGGYTELVDWIRRTHPTIVLPDTDKLVEKEQSDGEKQSMYNLLPLLRA